jgi:signal transduction histidine kinase
MVRLRFDDTGPGIAPDVLPKVFDPLFSTRSFGTGLGLPTVRQIVEQHGGAIEIASEVGHGTSVLVTLPLVATLTELAA